MVTINDVKEELGLDISDTTVDSKIQKYINQSITLIKGYCNNDELNLSDPLAENYVEELDEVILYIVAIRFNPDTKIAVSAGKVSDNGGLNTAYREDFPILYKELLKPFKKNPKVKFL